MPALRERPMFAVVANGGPASGSQQTIWLVNLLWK